MKTQIKLGFGNRFKAQVIQGGVIVRETEWKHNLILNQGLDNVASHVIADLFKYCAIGTGSTAPANSQTGLDNEIRRSNTYLTGSPNCTSALVGNVLTHTRTFDFPLEITGITYAEVGWSHSATATTNLNTRGLFGSPISVASGQSLRVVYQFVVTITPNTQRALTAPITGWPSRQWTLTATGTGVPAFSVVNQPTIGGGDTFDYLATDEPFKVISAGTTGLSAGTTYYAGNLLTSQFQVRATAGGANIGFTNGTLVIVTNANGFEQRILVGMAYVNADGSTNLFGFDAAGIAAEPSVNSHYIGLSPYTGAFSSFNSPLNSGITANDFVKPYTLQAYTTGNYYIDKQVQFLPADGGSNRDDWVWIVLAPLSGTIANSAYAFRFKHRQQKLSTATLTISLRASWTRS